MVHDLRNQRFGKLLVAERASEKKGSNIEWDCICDCGGTKRVSSVNLRKGFTRHCGCEKPVRTPKDIKGQKFGRLLAVENTMQKNKGGNFIWKFQCDCGNSVETAAGRVLFGHTQSCGCYAKEATTKAKTTHGMSKTKEYKCWNKAKERCHNPSSQDYEDYGAKGTSMSEEFRDSFELFLEHVGKIPKDGKKYSIDRIDNSKGYERGNIRWATDIQQARNKTFQKNNSSGFTGVTWDAKPWKHGVKLYAKAYWKNLDGSNADKRFSVDVYGLLPAFKMACEYRAQIIQKLNEQGAGYSENHGK